MLRGGGRALPHSAARQAVSRIDACMKSALASLALMAASPLLAQEDEAHRIDRLQTAEANRQMAAQVQARDRAYARGNARVAPRAQADYAAAQRRYERDMAIWRRRVAACQAGDYSACDQR